MPTEALYGIGAAVGVAVGVPWVVYRWLSKTTQALESLPALQAQAAAALHSAEEAVRSVRRAHERLDGPTGHDGRITRMETRWELHDRDQDRRDEELTKRLDRLEAKVDRLLGSASKVGG